MELYSHNDKLLPCGGTLVANSAEILMMSEVRVATSSQSLVFAIAPK